MSVRLILMRHAKSSWDQPWSDDHARELNGRGRRSAHVLGNWLRDNGYVPDEVLCSSARRCRQTWEGLNMAQAAEFHDDLYHADVSQMLNCLRKAHGQSVLMLGHNPGISALAQNLLSEPVMHDRFADYPTGATLVAEFEIEQWSDLYAGTGRAVDFVIPRALLAG